MGVLGIDVSHYQGEVNWHQVSKSDFRFAYMKATEGSTFEDSAFQANWAGARDAGLLHGAYHFARPGSDPETQAAHFAAVVGPSAWGELPPALDLETGDNLPAQAIVSWTLAFIRKAESLFGRQLLIYTGAFWRNALGNPVVQALSSRLLWTARYSQTEPVVPNTWTQWAFWQFTDGVHGGGMSVPGVRGPCDCNRFRGDAQALMQLTTPGASDAPRPTPSSDPNAWPGQYFVWPHQPVIRNAQVRTWQARMHGRGYTVAVDGAYGPQSKRACVAFQRETGLTPDGIVGRQTWEATFSPS